jgi:hypothetical protein
MNQRKERINNVDARAAGVRGERTPRPAQELSIWVRFALAVHHTVSLAAPLHGSGRRCKESTRCTVSRYRTPGDAGIERG